MSKKKHDTIIFGDYIRSNSEKGDIAKKFKKIIFCRYQQIKIHCVQVFTFMKPNYFSIILRSFCKTMEVLVKNVMKAADVNKLFLAIFKRTYYGPCIYITLLFVGVTCLYQE